MKAVLKDQHFDFHICGRDSQNTEVYKNIYVESYEKLREMLNGQFIEFYHNGRKIFVPQNRVIEIRQTLECDICGRIIDDYETHVAAEHHEYKGNPVLVENSEIE